MIIRTVGTIDLHQLDRHIAFLKMKIATAELDKSLKKLDYTINVADRNLVEFHHALEKRVVKR